jgi:hypothetical protein
MVIEETTTLAPPAPTTASALELEVADVTGMNEVLITNLDPATLVGAVTKSVAARMQLPKDVPFSLRRDDTSEVLVEDQPIGPQLRQDARAHLTLTPRTHLG